MKLIAESIDPMTVLLLDHGFVTLRNLAGPTRRLYVDEDEGVERQFWNARNFDADDTDPANAARMSFEQADSDRTYEEDMRLNEYLLKNHHDTPYEVIQVWLEIKCPMFVARQFHRHRTQTINESSGRYVTLPGDWYIPEVVGGKAKNKKQGQEDNLDELTQDQFKAALRETCQQSYQKYLDAMELGVAPEHARLFLHANHYVHYMFNMNLRNLLHFLSLRDHPHAQVEAQAYAKAITSLLEPHLPGLMRLYREYKRA